MPIADLRGGNDDRPSRLRPVAFTFTVGEGFVEPPDEVHNFRNASTTAPAKAIGFQIAPKGTPLQKNVVAVPGVGSGGEPSFRDSPGFFVKCEVPHTSSCSGCCNVRLPMSSQS